MQLPLGLLQPVFRREGAVLLQLLQLLLGLVQGGPGLLPGLVQLILGGLTAAAEAGEGVGPLPL